jgi:Putative metal-binding motif
MLRHLLFVAVVVSGCKSNPYCLNCGPGAGGTTSGGGDGGGDLAGADLTPAGLPDLSGGDGPCVAVPESCNGADDDCNGTIDDVDPAKLVNDPNNCGACGNACNYAATHQFGACTNSVCMPSGCTPGFVDVDNNPANGCEYKCAPTMDPTEICDGVDNDCNGQIDEGFTATYTAAGKPNYDSDINNCGGCGFVCNLQHAVTVCVPGAGGVGACKVDHCINDPGVETYKHDPSTGVSIDANGCEYKCEVPSSTAGDCMAAGGGGCTFPAETCDGRDEDCDFAIDNGADPNTPCGKSCPGLPDNQCQCKLGINKCVNAVIVCVGGADGAVGELCDGIDNNCDGKIDETFTAPYPGGFDQTQPNPSAHPLYNLDPNNCGGCDGLATRPSPGPCGGSSFHCALPHATDGCHSTVANAPGSCYVVTCATGFNYAVKTDSDKTNPACDVSAAGPKDSTACNVGSGLGCYYDCSMGFSPSAGNCNGCFATAGSEAICDGRDNNCDGCIDNGLTPPAGVCASQGVCAGSAVPITCQGGNGWKCNYSAVPGVDVDAMGNLTAVETKCDGRDNNCNGFCDENFPNTATPNNVALCARNPGRAAGTCTSGQGLCQTSGTFCCGSVDGSCSPPPTPATKVVCSSAPNTAAAQNETCNGVDDNCNGLIDDPNPANGKSGYRDPTITVAVPAGEDSALTKPTPGPAKTVYVYPFEASRPDASGSSPGGLSTRACAKQNVLPWGGATQDQARAACAGAGGRLCTAWEWQTSCEGPAPTPAPGPIWSYSANRTTYTSGVCNDQNRANPDAVWTTGHGPNAGTTTCTVAWPTGGISDMSGNLFEWSGTPVLFQSLAGGAAGSINGTGGTNGQMLIQGLSGLINAGAAPGYVIIITGSVANNGDYSILSVLSDTSVIVSRPGFSGGTANNLGWTLSNTYYKIRGGSFSSPGGGTTCEFDFDIVPPTFANNDVGFRCCFDKKPCAANADCTGIGTGICTNGSCP